LNRQSIEEEEQQQQKEISDYKYKFSLSFLYGKTLKLTSKLVGWVAQVTCLRVHDTPVVNQTTEKINVLISIAYFFKEILIAYSYPKVLRNPETFPSAKSETVSP